jgi:pimeloyl-ACP methyl ester carboxylesterase
MSAMVDVGEISPLFLDVNGVRTYVERSGGTGPPVVCIHTAGMDASEWRYTLPKLGREGFDAFAVDLPAHGKTDALRSGVIESAHGHAEFVWSLLPALGVERPIVVGCSVGGCIALDLAVHHGDALSGVVALAASAYNPTVSRFMLEMAREDAGSPSWADRAVLSARQSTGPLISAERLKELERGHRAGDPQVMAADLRAWNEHDLRGSLATKGCRAVVGIGKRDFFVPPTAVEELRATLGDGAVFELADIGHYPMVEWAEFGEWLTGILHTMSGAA